MPCPGIIVCRHAKQGARSRANIEDGGVAGQDAQTQQRVEWAVSIKRFSERKHGDFTRSQGACRRLPAPEPVARRVGIATREQCIARNHHLSPRIST
jgi:hypothetical protein